MQFEFGGSGVINEGRIKAVEETWHHRQHSIDLRIPPLSTIYIKLKRETAQERKAVKKIKINVQLE